MGVTQMSSWGYFMQGNAQQEEIMELGQALNNHTQCAVHYPAFGKNLFECKCGVTFMVATVKEAVRTGDWSLVDEIHKTKWRPVK